MAVIFNDELQETILATAWGRGEVGVSWRHSPSVMQAVPGLRGAYPMSAVSATGSAVDISGNALHLLPGDDPEFGYMNLAAYASLDGNDRLYNNGAHVITGLETFIETTKRGLTLTGWFYADSMAANAAFMGRWDASTNTRSYLIRLQSATSRVRAYVSLNGIATVNVTSVSTFNLQAWTFAAMRFTPGSELAVWINREKTTLAAGIPASLFAGATEFAIGATDVGTALFFTGDVSHCLVSMEALSDSHVLSIYEHQRAQFRRGEII